MLFSSIEYIFIFLPLSYIIYHLLLKSKLIIASKILLIFASLFFYGYYNISYIPLLLTSVIVNYCFGSFLIKSKVKYIASIAILFNIFLLGYFKYTNFFIDNIQILLPDTAIVNTDIILPLAISFFTFQQIAYIADCYSSKVDNKSFVDYVIFVTFFPQLIAGPIVHHREMMPQFKGLRSKVVNYRNIATGIFIFSVGLFKKVVIADYLAQIVNPSFANYEILSVVDAWKASLSYTFQLYFDFSGYTDMAIGSALMFNIKLPFNFDQPYKSCSIKEFWGRWHMTLSKFLKDYVYIPLGGSRSSDIRVYLNLMIVFFISGLWHGAGWSFILWGVMHGTAICVNRLWNKLGMSMNKVVAWFITFNFINISWVFFRAETVEKGWVITKKMLAIQGNGYGVQKNIDNMLDFVRFNSIEYVVLVVCIIALYFITPIVACDARQLHEKFKPNNRNMIISAILIAISVLSHHRTSEFLYFNF